MASWWARVSTVSWFIGLSGYFGNLLVGALAGKFSALALMLMSWLKLTARG